MVLTALNTRRQRRRHCENSRQTASGSSLSASPKRSILCPTIRTNWAARPDSASPCAMPMYRPAPDLSLSSQAISSRCPDFRDILRLSISTWTMTVSFPDCSEANAIQQRAVRRKIGGNLDSHGNCRSKKRSERGGEKRLMFRFLHYPFQTVFYLR